MLQKPNLLVLDEPTNHLDLESINALNVALQKFEGTVLLVTHDQDLIEEVGTRVWHFDNGQLTDFKGTYEEYASTIGIARHGVSNGGRYYPCCARAVVPASPCNNLARVLLLQARQRDRSVRSAIGVRWAGLRNRDHGLDRCGSKWNAFPPRSKSTIAGWNFTAGLKVKDGGAPRRRTAADEPSTRSDVGQLPSRQEHPVEDRICDVAIVGAGAAGLATAIFTRRLNPSHSILLLDSAVPSRRKNTGQRRLALQRHQRRGQPNATSTAASQPSFGEC